MTRLSVKKTYKLYIGGAFPRSESGRTYEAEGHNVARASRKDARDAVRAARSAFPGWAGATAYNRGQVLYRLAEMMEARATDLEQRVHRPRRGGCRDRSHGLVRGLDGQARPGARRLEPGRRSLLRLHRSRSRRASSPRSRRRSRRCSGSSHASCRPSRAATPSSRSRPRRTQSRRSSSPRRSRLRTFPAGS